MFNFFKKRPIQELTKLILEKIEANDIYYIESGTGGGLMFYFGKARVFVSKDKTRKVYLWIPNLTDEEGHYAFNRAENKAIHKRLFPMVEKYYEQKKIEDLRKKELVLIEAIKSLQ